MKNLLESSSAKRFSMLAAVMTACTAVASAQNYGTELLDSTKDGLVELVGSAVPLLQVVLGLGALVFLIMAVYKLIQGDREAANKLAMWLTGFTIGFILITVVQEIIESI